MLTITGIAPVFFSISETLFLFQESEEKGPVIKKIETFFSVNLEAKRLFLKKSGRESATILNRDIRDVNFTYNSNYSGNKLTMVNFLNKRMSE